MKAPLLAVAAALLALPGLAPAAPGVQDEAAEVRAGGLPCFLTQYALCGFQPAQLSVARGTVVRWTNDDTVLPVPHTVSSGDGLFESGHLAPGASFAFTFDAPGTYEYYCMYHAQMRGSVTAA